MAEPIKIVSHYEAAQERLPTQFRDKPSIDNLLKANFDVVQGLEDIFFDIRDLTKFRVASGVNLNRYGFVLGLRRFLSETDDEYRLRIAGEILARASDGSPDKIRTIIMAIFGQVEVNCFDHSNPALWETLSPVPFYSGGFMTFGYVHPFTTGFESLLGGEGDILKRACPASTGSTVYGLHTLTFPDENNLFIPCEVLAELDTLAVRDEFDVVDELVEELDNNIALSSNNISRFGENFELGILPEDGYVTEKLRVDPSLEPLSTEDENGAQENLTIQFEGIGTEHGVMLEISTHYL